MLSSAVLDFDGRHATFTCSTQIEPDQRVHLVGTEGRLLVEIPFNIPPDRPTRIIRAAGGDPPVAPGLEVITVGPADAYAVQADAFAAAIIDGTPVPIPPEDAIGNLAVIEALLGSRRGDSDTPRASRRVRSRESDTAPGGRALPTRPLSEVAMSEPFFTDVEAPIRYEGPDSDNPLAFRWYDADRVVAGRRMEDHLRLAACYWHSFAWDGVDMFGAGTLDRPWHSSFAGGTDPIAAAHQKMDAAFEFFAKLGVPFYCFHDRDIAPEGASFKDSAAFLDEMVDAAAGHQERTGVVPLWGTANLFTNPRYQAGAATNPDPEVFAYAAAQVAHCLEATHRLGGHNYVLWGGREGYETLLNTDMHRELDQLGRFLTMVVEHKHRIGFNGAILIEPKPFEPTKHQYDFDVAAVWAFLQRYDLVGEVKVNIEVNHATLAGHDFAHEIAVAAGAGILGSVDANAGDDRLGWDVDRFPVSVEQMTPATLEILRAGGLGSGGFNFDAKLRRQSTDRTDLFHAHIGGMDTLAARAAGRGLDHRVRRARRRPRAALRRLGRRARSLDPRRHGVPGVAPRAGRRHRRTDPRLRSPGGAREPRRPPHRPRHLTGRVAPSNSLLVAGVDSSTTATKVEVRELDSGRIVGRGSAPHPTTHPPRSEQDPAAWWAAFESAWQQAGAPDVAAISVAGQQHGMVALDEHRRVIRPAKLWNDTESAPDAKWLIAELAGGSTGVGGRVRRGAGGEHHDHQAVVVAPQRTRGVEAARPRPAPARLAHAPADRPAGHRPRRRVGHRLLVGGRRHVPLRPPRDDRRRPRLDQRRAPGARASRCGGGMARRAGGPGDRRQHGGRARRRPAAG